MADSFANDRAVQRLEGSSPTVQMAIRKPAILGHPGPIPFGNSASISGNLLLLGVIRKEGNMTPL